MYVFRLGYNVLDSTYMIMNIEQMNIWINVIFIDWDIIKISRLVSQLHSGIPSSNLNRVTDYSASWIYLVFPRKLWDRAMKQSVIDTSLPKKFVVLRFVFCVEGYS